MLRARRPPRAAVALARWRAAAVAIGARERVREEAEVCARRVAATEQAARMQVVQQAQALQAKLELLDSAELPAPHDQAAEFMSQSVVIALAGADKEDLHKAKWAEIPRQDYVDAARFCTSHGMAYDGMTVNEERARELFADRGRTSDAVLQQAAPALEVEGQLKHRLEGPADTGGAGVSHEQCASIDGAPFEAEAEDEDEYSETFISSVKQLTDELVTLGKTPPALAELWVYRYEKKKEKKKCV